MMTIDQILVTYDPQTPARESFELSMDEVKEYGEMFFSPFFAINVFLTNDTSHSFVKTADGVWTSMEFLEEDEYGEMQRYDGTFHDALNRLLDIANHKL